MTDYEGIQGSQHPRLADPELNTLDDHLRRMERREVTIFSVVFIVLVMAVLLVVYYAVEIDNLLGAL